MMCECCGKRPGLFRMGWPPDHFGMVCSSCDNRLGRKNLINCDLTMKEILVWEKEMKEVGEWKPRVPLKRTAIR